jgi:hypothetical protein
MELNILKKVIKYDVCEFHFLFSYIKSLFFIKFWLKKTKNKNYYVI